MGGIVVRLIINFISIIEKWLINYSLFVTKVSVKRSAVCAIKIYLNI